jgi:GT2 family glycosyltransferase
VAILIVAYHGGEVLLDCLDSLRRHDDATLDARVFVVDNAPPHADAHAIAARHPHVTIIRSEVNRGFAGGNNFGWQHIQSAWPQAQYLCLLNQDTLVTPGWLARLVAVLQQRPEVAAVQPRLTQHPAVDRINSAGNVSHFLGFTYCRGNGQADGPEFARPIDIDCPSGAAVLLRCDVIRQIGLFDEAMFLYLEDAELGWRVRFTGRRNAYEPASVVHHRYSPAAPIKAYFLLERNRWWLLGCYYRTWTLLLLLPALVMMEFGQLLFAASQGLLGEKVRAMRWFLAGANRAALGERRQQIQALRQLSDRAFTAPFTGRIELPGSTPALLRLIGNPIFSAYWAIVRHLL